MSLVNPKQRNGAEGTASGPHAVRRLQAAREFIESNLHRDDLTPALTAQALDISVRQLHLLFKPTAKSFSRYVLARRLEHARLQLAAEPERAVIDIAFACGIRS